MLSQSVNFSSIHYDNSQMSTCMSHPFWFFLWFSFWLSSCVQFPPHYWFYGFPTSSYKSHLALVYLSEFKSNAKRYGSLFEIFIRIPCVLSKVLETICDHKTEVLPYIVEQFYYINSIRSPGFFSVTFYFVRQVN